MKFFLAGFFFVSLTACQSHSDLQGTWQLVSSAKIEKGQTINDDWSGKKMIKILNATHFSFLNHDANGGKDSTTASFVAGGGTYTHEGDRYTEQVEYCSYRPYEGKSFDFTVEIKQDTLIQTGKEEVKEMGINHVIVEKYVRVKN